MARQIPSGRQRSTWRTCLLLTVLIAGGLLWLNAGVWLTTPGYEFGDYAANALQVREAKALREIYGAYSRWGFHHPGPGPFYVYALGEFLLFDLLHVVPTPGNGHYVANVVFTAFFFAAAVAACARWACSSAFLPLALLVSVLHLSAVGADAFLSTWPAHPPLVLLLCLLAAGASVAAGAGEYLPLLVLAGGFLVHLAAAQPLFVVPLSCLAYAGLLLSSHRSDHAALLRGDPREVSMSRRFGWLFTAWRRFPRAHLIALGLLTLFLLPLVVDAARGADSNLALLLQHRRAHRGEHKSFARALFYFLQFGSYLTYGPPGRQDFGHYSLGSAARHLWTHAPIYTFWLLSWTLPAASVLRAAIRRRRLWRSGRPRLAGAPEQATSASHFLAWACVFAAAGAGLAVAWGMAQDGGMLYYLGFANFAVYLFSGWLLAWWVAHRGLGRLAVLPPALYAVLLAVVLWRGGRLRSAALDPAAAVAVQSVREARTMERDANQPTLLLFDHADWPMATGVALQIERLGGAVCVLDSWATMFGQTRSWSAWSRRLGGDLGQLSPWRICRASSAPPGSWPLVGGTWLVPVIDAPLDPSGPGVRLLSEGGLATYALFGWDLAATGPTWVMGGQAALHFRPTPMDVAVTVSAEGVPCVLPGKVPSQRVRCFFNGHLLGERVMETPGALSFVVPATEWNARAFATLHFEFPDAFVPAALVPGGDQRLLAFMFTHLAVQVPPAAGLP